MNRADGLAGKTDGGRDGEQVGGDERNHGDIHCHVRSPSHRDADIGSRQGRGVVDAVADHRHAATRLLQGDDIFLLVRRKGLRFPMTDACFVGDLFGRTLGITRQEMHFDARLVQLGNSLSRGLLQTVGDGKQDQHFCATSEEDDAAAGMLPLIQGKAGCVGQYCSEIVEEGAASHPIGRIIESKLDAPAGDAFKRATLDSLRVHRFDIFR